MPEPALPQALVRVERHLALDLMRGLAAFAVATYHWLDAVMARTYESMGTFPIYMFFVLSALAMALVYADDFREAVRPAAMRSYFRNRFARLMPLLIAVTALHLGVFGLTGALDADKLARGLMTASGAYALGPAGLLAIGGGTWTLGIELAFYLLVPTLLLWMNAAKLRTLVLATIAATVVQQVYLARIAGIADPAAHWTYFISPLTFAPFFLAGLSIYKRAPARTAVWIGPALVGMLATVGYSLVFAGEIKRDNTAFLMLTCLAVATIYAAYRTDLPAVLRSVARFFGDVSYALYLLHPFVLFGAVGLGKRVALPSALNYLVFALVSLVIAYLVFRLFERPARDLLRGGRPVEAVSPAP